jgi:hypothetical protein
MNVPTSGLVLIVAFASLASAQDPGVTAQDPSAAPQSQTGSEDKRVFGVIPNNRTTEASLPFAPISAGRKMTIAAKDSFDWPVYLTSGLFASLYQLEDQNHSFGQGMSGYAKRFATSYGDQMMGNMFTEGIIPALGHQDPRYFRLGEGSKKSRAWYAVTRIFVARMDSGRNSFNFSEWGGNAIAVAVSNSYYPDTRNVSDNVQKLMVQCATDAFSNVLKEFWPDVKHHFQRKHEAERSSQ